MTTLLLTTSQALGPIRVELIDLTTGKQLGQPTMLSSARPVLEVPIAREGAFAVQATSEHFGTARYAFNSTGSSERAEIDLAERDFEVPPWHGSSLSGLSGLGRDRRPRGRATEDLLMGRLRHGAWNVKPIRPSRSTAKHVRLETKGLMRPVFVGSVDSEGTGIFVICPPFADGLAVTMTKTADPEVGGRKLFDALPLNATLADLCLCLASTSFPGIGDLWANSRKAWNGDPIRHYLRRHDFGAALICAAIIDRFELDDPIDDCLTHLSECLPDSADVHVLRASRIGKGLLDGGSAEIERELAKASDKQILLARSHRLANDLAAVHLGQISLRPANLRGSKSSGFAIRTGKYAEGYVAFQ